MAEPKNNTMSYRAKSNDSFNTRLRFFIFDCVINNIPFTEDDFIDFTADDNLIYLYTAKYYHTKRDLPFEGSNSLTVDEIYRKIKEVKTQNNDSIKTLKERYFNEVFKTNLPEDEYNNLINTKECHYCKITIKKLRNLHKRANYIKRTNGVGIWKLTEKSLI